MFKKLLFSTVLSLSLLSSVSPVFASSTNGLDCKDTIVHKYISSSDYIFADHFTDSEGITWYIKGITINMQTHLYEAHYEGHRSLCSWV